MSRVVQNPYDALDKVVDNIRRELDALQNNVASVDADTAIGAHEDWDDACVHVSAIEEAVEALSAKADEMFKAAEAAADEAE